MKKKNLSCKTFISVNHKYVLWYEVNDSDEVKCHLPKDYSDKEKRKILKNIGESVSEYLSNNSAGL